MRPLLALMTPEAGRYVSLVIERNGQTFHMLICFSITSWGVSASSQVATMLYIRTTSPQWLPEAPQRNSAAGYWPHAFLKISRRPLGRAVNRLGQSYGASQARTPTTTPVE
jgi:hypothetical protein